MKKPKPYNWKRAFREIKKAGYSQEDVVRQTGLDRATVSKLARGIIKSPTWETGNAILKLINE